MNRYSDWARTVCNCSYDCLFNPPCCISWKFETLFVVKSACSFDTPVAQDLSLEDYIADTVENAPNQRIEKIDFKKDIHSALDLLNNRERFIILNRFGLDNRKTKTLEELGNILGFSKERIRQIEMESLKKLRKSEETQYLKEYLV